MQISSGRGCIQRSAPTGKLNLNVVTMRLNKPIREIAKPAQLQVENKYIGK
jgi:hypothetical protein